MATSGQINEKKMTAPPVAEATSDGEGKWVFVPSRTSGKSTQAPPSRAALTSSDVDAKTNHTRAMALAYWYRPAPRVSIKRYLAGPELQPFLKTIQEAAHDIRDAGILGGVKNLLNPQTNYEFRLITAPAQSTIVSNVTAGYAVLSPLSAPEWSGILDALFDEYRVDRLTVHYGPIVAYGVATQWNPPLFSVGTDFNSDTTPASHVDTMTKADGRVHYVMMQSASGYFLNNRGSLITHASHVPKTVSVSGSVASVEWLGVTSAWPGSQGYFANTVGADGSATLTRLTEHLVRLRIRK